VGQIYFLGEFALHRILNLIGESRRLLLVLLLELVQLVLVEGGGAGSPVGALTLEDARARLRRRLISRRHRLDRALQAPLLLLLMMMMLLLLLLLLLLMLMLLMLLMLMLSLLLALMLLSLLLLRLALIGHCAVLLSRVLLYTLCVSDHLPPYAPSPVLPKTAAFPPSLRSHSRCISPSPEIRKRTHSTA
jgi:hypothetical protein